MNNTLTVSLVEKPVLPDNLKNWFSGPALVGLSVFNQRVFRPAEIEHVPGLYALMEKLDLSPGQGRKTPMDADMAAKLKDKLGDKKFAVIDQIYKTGHPILDVMSCTKGQQTPSGYVVKSTRIKRMSIMFYDSKSNSFAVPRNSDAQYGSLFYTDDSCLRVGIKKAKERRGESFAAFLSWRKDMWNSLMTLSRNKEVMHGAYTLGEAFFFATNKSKINPAFSTDINNMKKLELGQPVPRNAFVEMGGEPFSHFEANNKFTSRTVVSAAVFKPSVEPLSGAANFAQDAVVFNGDELPW